MRTIKTWAAVLTLAVFVFVGTAIAQNVYTPVDPCNLYANSVVTVPVSLATTSPSASAQLIAAPTTGKIWICNIVLQPASSSTVTLKYGTGSVCATGTASLTGALASSVSQNDAGGAALAIVPATNALCETVTGTGAQGYISYVVK